VEGSLERGRASKHRMRGTEVVPGGLLAALPHQEGLPGGDSRQGARTSSIPNHRAVCICQRRPGSGRCRPRVGKDRSDNGRQQGDPSRSTTLLKTAEQHCRVTSSGRGLFSAGPVGFAPCTRNPGRKYSSADRRSPHPWPLVKRWRLDQPLYRGQSKLVAPAWRRAAALGFRSRLKARQVGNKLGARDQSITGRGRAEETVNR
jgi:hypothetical protein